MNPHLWQRSCVPWSHFQKYLPGVFNSPWSIVQPCRTETQLCPSITGYRKQELREKESGASMIIFFKTWKQSWKLKKKYFWGKCPALWLGQLSILTESVLFFVVAQMLEFLNIVIECQTVTSSVWSGVSVAFPWLGVFPSACHLLPCPVRASGERHVRVLWPASQKASKGSFV